MAKSLYDILEVNPTASAEVIKVAYKVLMQKYHPDKHRGNARYEALVKALNRAYSVLSDPEKRAEYDAKLNGCSLLTKAEKCY